MTYGSSCSTPAITSEEEPDRQALISQKEITSWFIVYNIASLWMINLQTLFTLFIANDNDGGSPWPCSFIYVSRLSTYLNIPHNSLKCSLNHFSGPGGRSARFPVWTLIDPDNPYFRSIFSCLSLCYHASRFPAAHHQGKTKDLIQSDPLLK